MLKRILSLSTIMALISTYIIIYAGLFSLCTYYCFQDLKTIPSCHQHSKTQKPPSSYPRHVIEKECLDTAPSQTIDFFTIRMLINQELSLSLHVITTFAPDEEQLTQHYPELCLIFIPPDTDFSTPLLC